MFYLKLNKLSTRDHLKEYLKKNKIEATTHYEPLHLSTIIKKNTKEKKENYLRQKKCKFYFTITTSFKLE